MIYDNVDEQLSDHYAARVPPQSQVNLCQIINIPSPSIPNLLRGFTPNYPILKWGETIAIFSDQQNYITINQIQIKMY